MQPEILTAMDSFARGQQEAEARMLETPLDIDAIFDGWTDENLGLEEMTSEDAVRVEGWIKGLIVASAVAIVCGTWLWAVS